ncbi:tetratricopeptide repeat protein [Geobacter sp.]|uniref:tetratricopeptide repeat protein n=1 Tax=Geobacter sp. TaxID=46610 RepID=UPI00260B0078|nr:tetratricopeptide repeat protein [Geobacter sp.]
MAALEAAEWFSKGLEALGHDHVYLARTCFERAAEMDLTPKSCSYLALCQAKTRGKFDDAIELARHSIEGEPENTVHYLNLGRIYLLAGKRREAIDTFREGMKHGRNEEIVAELEKVGLRKPPPIPSLPRSHPLNKYLGIVLARLGLR